MEAAILILLMLACAAFIYHFTIAEKQAHRNKVNRQRFDIIDKCQQNADLKAIDDALAGDDRYQRIVNTILD